ncbi:MAG: PAC2 family protein [Desulfobacterota bacterium]|nr:PAC2 family protein [Thermodesulfobacteriota bacterium]
MAVRFYYRPKLRNPVMFVGWPGIGNIGILAVNALREILKAEEFGKIEGFPFFYPRRVVIEEGLLKGLDFPKSRFYVQTLEDREVLLFIGEEQPSREGRFYATGEKAYQMANLVLEVALELGCRRVYTSGACVSLTHHQMRPRVCAVATSERLIEEIRTLSNTVLMSELSDRSEGEGVITGLNGLLLGVAKSRGVEGACLMGEIPDWLSGASFPYPKASRSVLEVFAQILGTAFDLHFLDPLERQVEEIIEGFYAKFPPPLREEYDRRKSLAQGRSGPITIQAQIYIDEQYRKGGEEGGEGPI